MPCPLGRLHNLQFLVRRHAGEYTPGADYLHEIGWGNESQFGAVDHLAGILRDVELLGDGKRGLPVVAGDHHHLDTRSMAAPHRLAHPRPQRIDQRQKPEKLHRFNGR